MTRSLKLQRLIDFLLAAIWIAMGLYCKTFGQVPRHEAIVGEILGTGTAVWLTPLIGLGECGLGIWIATGHHRQAAAMLQILLVLTMNLLEFTLAVDHLLWGPLNLAFALFFCALVYWNAFILPGNRHVESN